MATYVVGDLQGCREGLEALLRKIRFRRGADRLLLTGDLVARGPDSLGCLRLVRELGDTALTVLGNHDLHLLALAARGEPGDPEDGLDAVLRAPDAEALLGWLRQQRMAWREREHAVLLVHAGVAPQWTQAQTLVLAREVQDVLRSPRAGTRFLLQMYGNRPQRWSDRLRGIERLRCIVNILTRARMCNEQGDFDFQHKLAPGQAPAGLQPWFTLPSRRSRRSTIVFGHWSTLGRVYWPEHRVYGLDTGYVWGGQLTALRLEDRRLLAVAAPSAARQPAKLPAGR